MRVVTWLQWFRVMNNLTNRVEAVCETHDEAVAYIANQP
jgi:hypothetical protein